MTNSFIWGYYITPKNDKILYKISKYIYPYDIDLVKNQISENIRNICSSEDYSLSYINSFDIKTSGDNLI